MEMCPSIKYKAEVNCSLSVYREHQTTKISLSLEGIPSWFDHQLMRRLHKLCYLNPANCICIHNSKEAQGNYQPGSGTCAICGYMCHHL